MRAKRPGARSRSGSGSFPGRKGTDTRIVCTSKRNLRFIRSSSKVSRSCLSKARVLGSGSTTVTGASCARSPLPLT